MSFELPSHSQNPNSKSMLNCVAGKKRTVSEELTPVKPQNDTKRMYRIYPGGGGQPTSRQGRG